MGPVFHRQIRTPPSTKHNQHSTHRNVVSTSRSCCSKAPMLRCSVASCVEQPSSRPRTSGQGVGHGHRRHTGQNTGPLTLLGCMLECDGRQHLQDVAL